jgi:hypothetical protein
LARKSGRGVPKCVIQEEPKRKTKQDQMQGTKKAAALTDNPEIQDLAAFSVHDTKPAHFLSMACSGLKLIEKRKIFERKSSTNVSMAFLWPEVTDLYNNGMNNVDIADHTLPIHFGASLWSLCPNFSIFSDFLYGCIRTAKSRCIRNSLETITRLVVSAWINDFLVVTSTMFVVLLQCIAV